MPEHYQWQSGLASLGIEARARVPVADAGVLISERSVGTQLAIRGDAGNADLGAAAVEDSGASARLGEALTDMHHAIVDVSHSRTVIRLQGRNARDVLMKGTNIDVHPRVFGPDSCIQSHLGRCHMLLHQLDEEPAYDIYVHRSFAVYAWTWLCDAAREYGIAVLGRGE